MSKTRLIEDILDSISVTHKFDKDKLVFLNTSDVLEGKILIDDYMYVDDMKGQAKKTIKNDDILFSEIRPKNKRYAFVKVPNPEDYVVSTKLMVLRNKTKDVLTKYVYYFLTYEGTLNYLQMRAENRIGSFPQITYDILKELEVNVPETNIQQRIVDVISALDAKIELNQRINAELESMAKTLYGYWFVQFDFPNEKGKPYKSAGGEMVWNGALKREIPLGWEVKSLFDGMDVQYGFPFSTTKFTDEITDKPVIRIRDILENTISTYTTEVVDDKYRLQQKDLLIGMDGNFHLNFWDKDGAYLNQRSVRIRSKKDSTVSNFQAYFELSPHIKAREKNVSRTTVGHLSDKDLKRLFVIASKKTGYFNPKETFDSFLKKIILNRLESQTLTELRDWLLPMLMNGQVTIQ